MKDPIRLRDSASGASDGVRDLLAGARKTRQMTDVERARILAKGAKIAAMPVGGLLSSPALIGTGKIVASVVVLIAGAKALPSLLVPAKSAVHEVVDPVVEMVRPEVPSALIVPEEVPSAVVVSTPESLVTATAPAKAISRPVVRQAKPIASTTIEIERASKEDGVEDGDELTREARQLGEAGRVVATNPSRALELLEVHREAFPKGKLGSEREVLVIDALLRAGRVQEARTRGDALLSQAKGSLYEARVRRMLENMKP